MKFFFKILILVCFYKSFAQEKIHGKILTLDTKEGIPFATIILKSKSLGTISNKEGEFSLEIYKYSLSDTLSFIAIGYKTKNIPAKNFKNEYTTVFLDQNITQIDPVFLNSQDLSAEDIVEKVLENKDDNYKFPTTKSHVFLRRKLKVDFNDLKLDYKKTTIPWLSKSKLKSIEESAPKHQLVQSIFVGNICSAIKNNKKVLKINPIKAIRYKTKELDEMDVFKSFSKMFSDTQKKEYWKLKSGIFGHKLKIQNDSLNKKEHRDSTQYFKRYLLANIQFHNFDNKDTWEVLHKTNRYDYENLGITTLNNEEVYTIKFKPKRRGVFKGILYISVDSYALVKANYEYAENKKTDNLKIFGYYKARKNHKVAISFKKVDNHYELRFFSYEIMSVWGLHRKIALQKKKERFLFDKKLKELKLDLKVNTTEKISFDFLILESDKITSEDFTNFKESKTIPFKKIKDSSEFRKKELGNDAILRKIEMYKFQE